MTAPTVTPLPDAPSRQDDPSTFVTKSDAFVAALPDFGTEMNAVGQYVEDKVDNPDFEAVVAALPDIGTVAGISADVTECADNMAAILAAPQAAIDAATAAASVYVTSYGHAFSTGDRTATGVANGGSFTGVTPASGTLNNLIDGATANNTTDSVNLNGVAFTGVTIWQWIFPKGVWLLCDEWRVKNSGTQSYGTGKLQALKPDGTWVDVSADANNGGATTVTRTATAVDKGGYGGLRLLGTGGTGGSGWMQEVEFKLCPGTLNGTVPLPPATERGKTLTQDSTVSGDVTFREPVGYFRTIPSGHAPLCEYLFDGTGSDTTVRDWSGNGKHIDLAAAVSSYGGSYKWAKQGLHLLNALAPTPSITNWRTIVAVFIPERESTRYQLTTSSTSGQAYVRGATFNGNCTMHTGNGGESVAALYADISGSAGTAGFKMDRGGPVMVFIDRGSAQTSQICLGGPITATTTNRSVQLKCVYLAAYSTAFNSTERNYIRDGLRRGLEPRGVYFDWRDCPVYHIGALHIGQSNVGNASIAATALGSTNLSSAAYTPSTWILSAGRQNESWMAAPQEYRVGFNSIPGRGNGVGFEAGMAFAHEEAYQTVSRKLAICKIAPGSASVYQTSNNNSWNVANSVGVGLMGYGLKRFWDMEQYFLDRGIGVHLVVVNTQNGEQECGATGTSDGAPAVYQTRMQEIWDKLKEQLPFSGLKMQVGQLAPWQSGSPLTQASVDTVRAAQASLVTANSSEMTLVSTASGLLQGDFLHFTADNAVARGRTFYAGMATY